MSDTFDLRTVNSNTGIVQISAAARPPGCSQNVKQVRENVFCEMQVSYRARHLWGPSIALSREKLLTGGENDPGVMSHLAPGAPC